MQIYEHKTLAAKCFCGSHFYAVGHHISLPKQSMLGVTNVSQNLHNHILDASEDSGVHVAVIYSMFGSLLV